MALPCVEFVDESAPYLGEPSCAFGFAESFLPRPITRLSRFLKNESSLMVFANTFDNKQIYFPRDERLCGDRRPILVSSRCGAEEVAMGVACLHTNRIHERE